MAALELTKLAESGRRSRTPLDEISDDLIQTVEEAYADSDGNANSRYETPSLGSKTDAEEWLHNARSYGWHRGQGDNAKGRIVIAGNSTRDGKVRFRVYDFTE